MLAVVVAVVAFGSPAFARRGSNRSGINFGSTVRILDNDDRTVARNSKSESSSVAVNPYLGYAFDDFNIGVALSTESKESHSKEDAADGLSTTERHQMLTSKSAGLFARYLFGNVFFFEAGAGMYQQSVEVTIETKRPDGGEGSFTGAKDGYKTDGVGPGYNVGAGLELPMGGGFFFTSAYQLRMVQLRDKDQGGELGKKKSQEQKREVLFGIEYFAH